MIGYLECLREQVTTRLADAVSAAGFDSAAGGGSAVGGESAADWLQVRLVPVEKRAAHGVFTSNAALLLAQKCSNWYNQPFALQGGKQPFTVDADASRIAQAIADKLVLDALPIARVTVAAPGFLNFYLADGWQQRALACILRGSAISGDGQLHIADALACLDFETQYAYNRICNQLALLTGLGYSVPDVDAAHLELLTAPQELRLMEHLAAAPCVGNPAQARQRARQYLSQLALAFHHFFNISQIRGEAWEIAGARMALLQGCKLLFESVLKESFL